MQQAKILKLEEENAQLQKLADDFKELQTENEALKAQVKELKTNLIDPSKYRDWSYEDILLWITGLEDGKYKGYDKVLMKVLAEEQPCGKDLGSVDAADVKRWGVTKFADIKDLCNHIKQLINNNAHQILNRC